MKQYLLKQIFCSMGGENISAIYKNIFLRDAKANFHIEFNYLSLELHFVCKLKIALCYKRYSLKNLLPPLLFDYD